MAEYVRCKRNGLMNSMRIIMDDMNERNSDTIINFSSIAGIKAFANNAAYCATKYGFMGLTESAHEELSSIGVHVMRILPGAVQTELLSHTTNDDIKVNYEKGNKDLSMESIRAEDIAETVKFMYEMPQAVNIREVQITDIKQT